MFPVVAVRIAGDCGSRIMRMDKDNENIKGKKDPKNKKSQVNGCTCPDRQRSSLIEFWCDYCQVKHKFSPPRRSYFGDENSELSERDVIFRNGNSFYKFQINSNEVYIRTKHDPHKWFFQRTPACRPYKLCDRCASDLERIFRRLIPRTAEEKEEDDDFSDVSEKTMTNIEKTVFLSAPKTNIQKIHPVQSPTTTAESFIKGSKLKNENTNFNNLEDSHEKEYWIGLMKQVKNNSPLQLFSRLQAIFRDLYLISNWTHWTVKFAYELVFHFETMVREKHFVKTESTILSGNVSQKEILILGAPGFGKTTLCKLMSFGWASRLLEMKGFELCVYCSLTELTHGPDLSREIVSLCHKLLRDDTVSLTEIHPALEKNSEKIILLLDGLDHLTNYQKRQVLNFVRSRPTFCKSALVVTSEPSPDPSLLENFKRQVVLKGFSLRYLNMYLRSMEVSVILENEKFNLLSELSPFFVAWSAKAIRANYKDISSFDTAYSLLDLLMRELITSQSSTTDYDRLKLQLGKTCFEKLVEGTMIFREKEIQFPFGDKSKLLENCNILHRINMRKEHGIWRISSKVLQVFFATIYLRKMWNTCQDRVKFLKEVFCCNSCRGENVTEETAYVYYVGLIPEIVLKYDSDLSLRSADFEMIYDVAERIESSQAFDSVNLLQRIKSSHLKRFGFQVVNSPDNDGHFHFLKDLQCSKNLENFKLEYNFYEKKREDKIFLKMEICNTNNCFFGVIRETRNHKLDRLYLDFCFSKLVDLFPVLNTILSRYVKGLDLHDNIVFQSFEKFVVNLVQKFLECTAIHEVTVSCKDDVDRVFIFHVFDLDPKTTFSTIIQRRVNFSREKFYSPIRPTKDYFPFCETTYSERQYFIKRDKLCDLLFGLKNKLLNPRISLSIW